MSTYLTDDELKRSKELLDRIQKIFSERVVGQENLRETLIVGLLAQGHILMESVPGLAKTTAAQTIAQAISGSFHRIQCTPDLMPNDIVGTRIWNQAENEMTTELGPVTPISCFWMKSTVHRQRPNLPCSRPCRKARPPSVELSIRCPSPSW